MISWNRLKATETQSVPEKLYNHSNKQCLLLFITFRMKAVCKCLCMTSEQVPKITVTLQSYFDLLRYLNRFIYCNFVLIPIISTKFLSIHRIIKVVFRESCSRIVEVYNYVILMKANTAFTQNFTISILLKLCILDYSVCYILKKACFIVPFRYF